MRSIRGQNYKWWAFLALAIGLFSSVAYQGTIIVALPSIVDDFGTDLPTAQWVLIRALGRPDAFPTGALALRRAVSRVFCGGKALSDAQLEEFSRRWAPWRTYATVYLFTALRGGMA